MGEPDQKAATDTKTMYAMERALVRSHFSSEENRDPTSISNIYPLKELEEKYTAIGWNALGTLPGSGPVRVVDVNELRYFEGLNTQLLTAPLDD